MNNWITGIAGTLLVALLLWQSRTIVEVTARQDLAEKTISQPVENSLRELRDKTNQQAESCNAAGGRVSGNTSEIGYLKERIAKLEAWRENRQDAKP